MKTIKSPVLACILFIATYDFSHANVLYSSAGPHLVSDNNAFPLPGLSLSRGATATGTLYFKYTVTNPQSNTDTENYYAGLSFYDLGNEHLGVGNGWNPYAYSAFGAGGDRNLNSATPEPGQSYQLVRSADVTTIVIRVDFNSGADDHITVWLNPNLALTEEAQNPALTTTFTANADFDTIYLREGGNNGNGWSFSNISIAENSTDAGFFAAYSNPVTFVWNGGGSNNLWSTASNWQGGTVADGTGNTAIFSQSSDASPTLDSARSLGGLGFANANHSITGSAALTLDVATGTPAIDVASGATATIGAPLAGVDGLSKTGNGNLRFTAASGYSGNTHVNAGRLTFSGNVGTPPPASPSVTYTLAAGNENWPADKRAAVVAAMDEAVATYNRYGSFNKALTANYDAGVPTAQAGYGGWIDFGGSISVRTALHEMGHTMGVGTYWTWSSNQSGGLWTGANGGAMIRGLDGPFASIGCDAAHFWPYGLNYDNESGPLQFMRHVKVVSAMRQDMGIVSSSELYGYDGPFDIASGAELEFSGNSLQLNGVISGAGALFRSGTGKLILTAANTYTGGTVVNGGTLTLDGASGGSSRIRGALTVNSGATVNFSNDDGTGLGWNEGAKVTSLSINGGTVSSPGSIHVWNLGNSLTLAGGTFQSNNGTSDAAGPQLEWSGTTITSQANANPSVIAGRVRFRPDAGTLHTIDVADGAAATDLLVSAALTESSRSNLVKTGAGTLRITGSVQITGTINVEAGTLDFAPSAVSPSLRISVADGARLNLSNAGTTLVKNVYIAGQRLTAGTWGAPGSGAANVSSAFTGTGILQVTDTDISNRERWKRMKYGQFTHYVWDGSGVVTRMPDGSNSPSIDYVANNFDAAKYANDLQSMGVEYVIFTAWHANFNPLFNSSTFDKYGYWYRRSQRDMLGDMINAVKSKGIRVLFYTHPNQPIDFNWWTHNNMINDIYAEMIDRYGDQIDGFYMDENDPGGNQDGMVDFVRLGQTIHRRNPDLMLIQNFYGNLYCNSVPMGESGPASANFSKDVSWPSVTSYAQVMSNSWSAQVPVTQFAATRSAEGIFRGAVTAACSCTDGGGTAWASGPFPGGQWEQGVLEVMQGAGALMAPLAESIKNTYPSTSFTFSGSWGGATRAVDDSKEYIHVLWPPSGNTLTLPAPTDGKVFANARLLANGQPVTLAQNGRAVRFTLTGTNTWDANDTVIAMDVVSVGDPYLANNTTPDATYTGSWVYSGNRATGEFGRDVHSTTVNGDFVEYNFNGTDIELVVSCGPNRGTMDIYIDGVFKQSANATDPTDGLRKTIYRGSGLARGSHTLKVVKTGGTYLAIDAFKANELIDSTDPDVGYQALTFFNNTDTTPNPIGYIEYDWNWSWQQRDRNEYNYDAHWAQGNGSTFWIHFNGTGVQFIGTYDGIVDFYIDEVFVKRVNMKDIGGMARCLGLDLRGLPEGNHTLKGVKVGDTYLLVDAFFVYNSTNSSWSSQTDSASVGGSYRRSSAYGDAATLAFQGTGIEIIAPHQSSGGTVAVDLQGSGYQTAARQFVSQYAGAYRAQNLSFASRNVATLGLDNYSLSMSHNRGFGSIAVDAFRVYKNRPGSGPALKWGVSGGGGSGTWDVNTTANWWDGANATAWYDFGASDYSAQFAGTAGTVSLAANVSANRLAFDTSEYVIQGNTINLNGIQPVVTVASGATTTLASATSGSNGLKKDGAGALKLTGTNSYSGATTVNGGELKIQSGVNYAAPAATSSYSLSSGTRLTFYSTNNPILDKAVTGTGDLYIDGTGAGDQYANRVNLMSDGLRTSSGSVYVLANGRMAIWGGNGSGAIPDASVVDVAGLISIYEGKSETIGGLTGGGIIQGNSGATLTIANSANSTFSGTLRNNPNESGVLSVTKNGTGTLTLTGTNTYTGATTVNQGVLSVTGSIQSTSSVNVAAGAELRSSGTLQSSGNVTNSGTLFFSESAVFSAGGTITNYGTIINGSPSLVLPGNIVNYGTILTLPSAPTGLAATPSGTSAVLGWSAVSGATGYRVKQSTSPSGPFTVVASPTTNSQTVSGLTAGTTYYYVVSAVNSVGEGANSTTASCAIGALPLPWVTADIGTVGLAGSAAAINGTYTVNGSGTGVYASTDQFRMVYQNSSGDCDMIARVDSLSAPSVSAKAGVMIRESLAANARCAGVYVTPSSGVQFIWRTTAGSMVSIATVSGLTAPRWVRMQRVGNSFRAYHSANGSAWTQFGGNKTIAMATSAYIGQATTSGTNSSLCTAVFSNLAVTP